MNTSAGLAFDPATIYFFSTTTFSVTENAASVHSFNIRSLITLCLAILSPSPLHTSACNPFLSTALFPPQKSHTDSSLYTCAPILRRTAVSNSNEVRRLFYSDIIRKTNPIQSSPLGVFQNLTSALLSVPPLLLPPNSLCPHSSPSHPQLPFLLLLPNFVFGKRSPVGLETAWEIPIDF